MAGASEIFDRIFGFISNKPATLYQIVYATRISARSVKRYLDIIEKVQNSPKIIKEVKGCRVFYRRG